ncbi:dynein axonemal intermediate chain 7-like isoform X2 [Tachypleus tridentatus]|uniref:dynein axonemal intermediate chain 7-like isoform X2 n=1 Tax=Tachypleus tridentatus TaxID=6853 RepID=UPI003FCEF90F
MPSPKKKKGKLTKAEKERRKKEEAERRTQEEELARKKFEEEERVRRNEEKAERERTEKRRAEEKKIRDFHFAETNVVLEKHWKQIMNHREELWEKKRWQQYINEVDGKPDPLILPEINSYISEMNEDLSNYNLDDVLRECHVCLSLINEVENAFLECPFINIKIETEWNETIRNVKNLIQRSLDRVTYTLLKNASHHMDPETLNMHYYGSDINVSAPSENLGHSMITYCLWANLSKNPRYKGMEFKEAGHKFELPRNLLVKDCAVRILHTTFDHYSDLCFTESSPSRDKNCGKFKQTEANIDACQSEEPMKDKTNSATSLKTESDVPETAVERIKLSPSPVQPITIPVPVESKANSSTEMNNKAQSDIPEVNDVNLLAQKEDVQNSQKSEAEENKDIVHMPYKVNIVPPKSPPSGMTSTAAAEFVEAEVKRYEQEMSQTFLITLKLPSSFLYLGQPNPVVWDNHKRRWITSGIYDVKYDEDEGCLSFKSAQFGIIGAMLNKYSNLPYQSWELKPGKSPNSVSLSITGAAVLLQFEILNSFCKIVHLQHGEKSIFPELCNKWMLPQAAVKELSRIGINVNPRYDVTDCIGVTGKDVETEEWVYHCMALVCQAFTFMWSRWNGGSGKDCIVMKFCEKNSTEDEDMSAQGTYPLILITPERATILKCLELSEAFSDEPLDDLQFYGDLYHLLMGRASISAKELIADSKAELYSGELHIHSFGWSQLQLLLLCQQNY